MHSHWMTLAIDRAKAAIASGQTPFGAVIVRGDQLLESGHNEVWRRTDPTAHAEIVAISRAAAAAGTIDLSGCAMYTTCEPCPMCAAAVHWARIDAVYSGASIADAAAAGFNELHLSARDLYRQGRSPVRLTEGLLRDECAALFQEWLAAGGRGY